MPIESPREAGLVKHPLMRTDFSVPRVMNMHHPRDNQYTPEGLTALGLRSHYLSHRCLLLTLQRSREIKAPLTWCGYSLAYKGVKLSYPQVTPDRLVSVKAPLSWGGYYLTHEGVALSHAEEVKSSYPRITLEEPCDVVKAPLSWGGYSLSYGGLVLTYPQECDTRVKTPLSWGCESLSHGGLLLTYPQ